MSVGVLVTLERSAEAGGHVKTWERFAEAAARSAQPLDLTVYFLGSRAQITPLGPRTRYVHLPAVLGTARFGFLRQGAGATDLAPYHCRLAGRLAGHDVLHATDVFSFSRTALRVARRAGLPLVSSIHTDLSAFTEIYSRELLGRMPRALTRLLLARLRADRWLGAAMARSVDRLLARSDRVLASREEDFRRLAPLLGAGRVARLRRGIDKTRFRPGRRDRRRLAARYGIPAERPVVLFAGRVDESKGALTVAAALRLLIASGRDVHLLVAGAGSQAQAVRRELGERATLAGVLSQDELASVYASCDLFAFPSTTEVVGNVVIEARACGLPVLVAAGSACAGLLREPGRDGVVVSGDAPEAWARAIAGLLDDPILARALGAAAAENVRRHWPDWGQVLEEDLVPVWRAVLETRARAVVAH